MKKSASIIRKEMKNNSFELKQFGPEEAGSCISITGSIIRYCSNLSLAFRISGDLSDINIPKVSLVPERGERLWEDTCLELFLGPEGSEAYLEFNLSPSGHWNVYRFNSYRAGMQTEQAAENIRLNVRHRKNAVTVSTEICINKLIPVDHAIDAAISAVIRHKDSTLSYWALGHCSKRPDFHNRESFIIRL